MESPAAIAVCAASLVVVLKLVIAVYQKIIWRPKIHSEMCRGLMTLITVARMLKWKSRKTRLPDIEFETGQVQNNHCAELVQFTASQHTPVC